MGPARTRGEAYASPARQEAGTTFSGLDSRKKPSWPVRPACTGTRKGLRLLQQIPCRGRAGTIAVLSAIIAESRIARWTAQMTLLFFKLPCLCTSRIPHLGIESVPAARAASACLLVQTRFPAIDPPSPPCDPPLRSCPAAAATTWAHASRRCCVPAGGGGNEPRPMVARAAAAPHDGEHTASRASLGK